MRRQGNARKLHVSCPDWTGTRSSSTVAGYGTISLSGYSGYIFPIIQDYGWL